MAETLDKLPPEFELALAYTVPETRADLRAFFSLDQRISRLVAGASEPVLCQMRLAWWRDMLGLPVAQRPTGDAVLDDLGEHWAGREPTLIELVDGWEVFATMEAVNEDDLSSFARGRGAPFIALGGQLAERDRIAAAAKRWALADAAARVSDEGERAAIVRAAMADGNRSGALPRNLRGLAVLEALSLRALARGGRPLMEGRGASLAALRAGMLGR